MLLSQYLFMSLWEFAWSRVGLPNDSTELVAGLLGVRREEPEQVRDSDTPSTRTRRDPESCYYIENRLEPYKELVRFWL